MSDANKKPDLAIRYVEVTSSGDIIKVGAQTIENLKNGRQPVSRPGGSFDGIFLLFERNGKTLTKLVQANGFRMPIKDGRIDHERYQNLRLRRIGRVMGGERGLPSAPNDTFDVVLPMTIGQVFAACQLYGLFEGRSLDKDTFYKPFNEAA